jgi:drug/metabolite transporter (DMT)-like permease
MEVQGVLLSTRGWGSLRPAAQVLIAALPLVAVVLLAILSFFFILWEYRRKRLLIERGGTPVPRNIDEKLLLIGIVALFVGVGLLIFFALKTGLSDALLGGIIPTTAGMGIITYYVLVQRRKTKS